MTALCVSLGALALWASLATATAVARDGYRQVPVDWSRPGVGEQRPAPQDENATGR